MKKILFAGTLISMMLSLLACGGNNPPEENQNPDENESKYTEALELIESGDYEEAYALFSELGDYKDSEKEAAKFHYVPSKISLKETVGGDEAETYETVTISYNEQNLPIKRTGVYRSGSEYSYEYTYDENLNVIKEVYTTSSGEKTVYDYTFDENENLIKEECTDSIGKKSVNEYFYNEDATLVKAVYTEPDGYQTT